MHHSKVEIVENRWCILTPNALDMRVRGKGVKIANVDQFSTKIGQERKERSRVTAGLEAKTPLDKPCDTIFYSYVSITVYHCHYPFIESFLTTKKWHLSSTV